MPVKIEGAFSTAVGREQTLRSIRGVISRSAGSQALTIKTHLPQLGLQKIHTSAIVFTRRNFRWDRDKVRQQCRHLALALAQPRKNRGALRRHVVRTSVHRRECQELLWAVPRSILVRAGHGRSAAAIFGDDDVRRFQIAMITPAEWAAASASAISAAYFIVSFKGRPPLFARSKVVPATYSTAMKQTSCSSKMS